MTGVLASFVWALAVPTALFAQDEAGRGALRPYVHVLIAYGIAWLAILFWVWRISRMTKRVAEKTAEPRGEGERSAG